MSTVAKIFVVVNLLLGVAAFGSAATLLGAQDDYKSALETASKQFEELKAQYGKDLDDLNQQLNTQNNRASQAVADRNRFEAEVATLKNSLAEAQRINQNNLATIETLTKEIQSANKINTDNKDWLDRLAAEAKKATDDANKARRALDDEINNRVQLEQQITNLNEQVATLMAEKGDTEKELRNANFYLAEYRKRLPGGLEPSQGAEGRVLNVRGNLVQISVGTKDKVRAGDLYHISRGSSYVGMIRITNVEKDSAVGTFDSDYSGPASPPQKGDRAYPGN